MDTNELYETFREEVVDTARPYLWKPKEVWRYARDAHRMFWRLVGGIPDFTGSACFINCPQNVQEVKLHPSILKITSAYRMSDMQPVDVINYTDIPVFTEVDYGRQAAIFFDTTPGLIKYLVIGQEYDTGRLLQIPMFSDQLQLSIYRLPMTIISGPDQAIYETKEEHHIHLIDWMKHLAYKKQDAETYDKEKSSSSETRFREYCEFVKKEWERKKTKPRTVRYGGIGGNGVRW